MVEGVAFLHVSPVIPVLDLDAALDRYRRLGFAVRAFDGDARYGFADRDTVSLHLSEWAEHDPQHTASVVYFYVADADSVHAEWAAADVAGRLGAPHDTEYGLREFAFVDSDGTLHRVGSPLERVDGRPESTAQKYFVPSRFSTALARKRSAPYRASTDCPRMLSPTRDAHVPDRRLRSAPD